MIKQIQLFLGPARIRAWIILLGTTGLLSLILNSVIDQYTWVPTVQSLLVFGFILGTLWIFGGRLSPEQRLRWLAIMAPAITAVFLGLFVLPDLLLPFLGAALGWIVAVAVMSRSKTRMEYQKAIRHLRKEEYEDAVKVMDDVIKDEADNPAHYRLRAEVLRLWGKLGRARRDYEAMIAIDPQSAVGYNGLAEVHLQRGDFMEAHNAAVKALELSPNEWVAAYNLGMIEDRLEQSTAALEHLQKALALKVPDTRHRVLIHFYMARAYSRLGDLAAAQEQVTAIKRQKNGLEEWEVILDNEMAAVLRAVLADDVKAAQDLLAGTLTVSQLGGQAK